VGDVGVSQWRLTGFYGEPSGKNKYKSWEYIRQLNIEFDLPWIILGDFNEILYAHEKEGGNMRPPGMTQNFRQCLSECGLEDLGYIGDIFTWRRGEIRERLDRAVGNERWSAMFPFAAVINKEHSRSDHRPIVVDTEYHVGMCPSRRSARQFEARWLK
jgi:endonuclease/exonuclease/phosphatase family metal-dependent hydrolase